MSSQTYALASSSTMSELPTALDTALDQNNFLDFLRPPWASLARYLYTSSQSMEDLRLLQDLPPSLATRLAITVHRRIVVRLPLFNTLSDLALLSVLARLHPIIFVPGQVCTTARKALATVDSCGCSRLIFPTAHTGNSRPVSLVHISACCFSSSGGASRGRESKVGAVHQEGAHCGADGHGVRES